MPISFTDKFGVKKEFMKNVGAFDPIIDLDTKFFIDPALLDLCEEVEFINAHDKIKEYFSRIILLLSLGNGNGFI